jgi:hypothetical protein
MIARVLAFSLLTAVAPVAQTPLAAFVDAAFAPQPPAVQPPPGQPPVVQPPPGQPPAVQPPPGQPPQTTLQTTAKPPAPPRREGQSFNVKVDVTISEQTGGAAPLKKTVTVVAGEGTTASVRSQATFGGSTPSPLNVDIVPTVTPEGKIRLTINVQYDAPAPSVVADASGGRAGDTQTIRSALGNLTRTELRQGVTVILESGKPLVISQSADPVGDRKVTVEVTGTVLK